MPPWRTVLASFVCTLAGCSGSGHSTSTSSGSVGGAASTSSTATTTVTGVTSAVSGSSTSASSGGAGPSCPAGATLVRTIHPCSGTTTPPPALVTAANAGVRGDVIGLGGIDVAATPCAGVLVCRPSTAPTLLFSDEPETTSADGIVFAELLVPGAYRLYVYHVNGAASPRKFTAVVLNQGTSDATLTIQRRGLAGPGVDYVAIGKAAVHAWLAGPSTGTVTVPAGKRVLVDAALDGMGAGQDELVHAIIDFNVDAQVKLSVVSIPASADATTLTASLGVLPNSGKHLRGTFPGAGFLFLFDGTHQPGVRGLDLGDGTLDLNIDGHSFVDGNQAVTLLGGYGVTYDFGFDLATPTALAISARGGAWGGAATIDPGADGSAPLVDLPSATVSVDPGDQAVDAGRFDAGTAPQMRVMTAGGSSLPIALLAVPLGG